MRITMIAAAVLFQVFQGCTSSVQGTDAASTATQEPGCSVSLAGDVPYTIENSVVLVPVTVNGVTSRFEVDTGSTAAISLNRSNKITRRFSVEWQPDSGERQSTTYGIIGIKTGLIDEVRVGNAIVQGLVAVTPIDQRNYQAERPGSGILGQAFLSNFNVEFDTNTQRMRLYQVSGCNDYINPPFENYSFVHLKRLHNSLLFAPVRFGGHQVNALIDTGANRTLLTATGAKLAGVNELQLSKARRVGELKLAGRSICEICVIEVHGVSLGSRELSSENNFTGKTMIPIALFKEGQFPFYAVIGIDLLFKDSFYISYATGGLFLKEQ